MVVAINFKEFKPHDLKNNKLHSSDRSFHDWYRFILSFPPHLVRYYFERFNLRSGNTILDPFCGTGTTIVEGKKKQLLSYGIEANPMAAFASKVKTDWNVDISIISIELKRLKEFYLRKQRLLDTSSIGFSEEQQSLILKNSISKIPLQKCLILLDGIKLINDLKIRNLFILALAHVVVHTASNLKFGPEVGVMKKKNYFWNKEGKLITPWPESEACMNSKVVEPTYEAAHCLYAGRLDTIGDGVWMGDFQKPGDIELYEMEEQECLDIDYPWQFTMCENIYKQNNKEKKTNE